MYKLPSIDFHTISNAIPVEKVSIQSLHISKALIASGGSDCTRRQYGAILVNPNNRVVATGYNAPPRGVPSKVQIYILKHGGPPSPNSGFNCCKDKNDPHGSCYDKCYALHAEHNAMMQLGFDNPYDYVDLYIAGRCGQTGELIDTIPCIKCARDILNYNVRNIYCLQSDGTITNVNKEELEITA